MHPRPGVRARPFLPPDPIEAKNDLSWTPHQIETARDQSRQRLGRGSTAAHGTPSRWRAGCPCDECKRAHNADLASWRDTQAMDAWAERGDRLCELVASGLSYQEALLEVGVTAQATSGHRRRDPDFAARLDAALMAGRDPNLAHGTPSAWKARCRCPECRTHHDAHRTGGE